MSLALYRKYRSKSLDEIVGQSHITDILRRSIETGNIAHAYLLTGPRGVGKTSIARILAHEINHLPYSDESTHLDIIEIDAASNNSVEDIRDLRERVQIAPTSAAKKIYIIDEVHMLSKSAFNALLKTLEEPPEHVVFILATTDVDKLPATIISRTQRFNFRAISVEDAVAHLATIAKKEKIAIDADALRLIAEQSAGSFRDSISMLDQLRSAAVDTISAQTVEQALGLAPQEAIETLLTAYRAHDVATIVTTLNRYERQGTPSSTLTRQLIAAITNRVINEPDLLALLDTLLDTSKSAWPYVKLLTALAASQERRTTAPQVVSTSKPQAAIANEPTPDSTDAPEPVEPTTAPSSALPSEDPPHETTTQPFAWETFLAQIKDEVPGTHTILSKCGYEFDGTTLTIYAGRKFNKTQIDKSHTLLSRVLARLAPESQTIVVLADAKPPKDSQTATVLDIMGGGEEVTL
jgi:DNA polymerase-3 subunit gamma/tau